MIKEHYPILDYLCENTTIPDVMIYDSTLKCSILKITKFDYSIISELFTNEIYKNLMEANKGVPRMENKPEPPLKKEMSLDAFNSFNTSISELIAELSKYVTHIDITEAKKSIKNAGIRVGQFYFKYEQVDEPLKVEKNEKN